MKTKNIAIGDFVQVKKGICHIEFEVEEICEVIDIDHTDKHGFDVMIQGKSGLYWVNHKNLKKPIKREPEPEPEPQLKQLDLSVFDGLDEKWRFAAVGKNGSVYKFRFTPKVSGDSYLCDEGYHKHSLVGEGYDASNWQNSLIERDTAKELAEVDLNSELTGSELCKAMLARGDKYVLCIVSPSMDAIDNSSVILPKVVTKFDEYGFITTDGRWAYAIPINNQGKPLTTAEAGF